MLRGLLVIAFVVTPPEAVRGFACRSERRNQRVNRYGIGSPGISHKDLKASPGWLHGRFERASIGVSSEQLAVGHDGLASFIDELKIRS